MNPELPYKPMKRSESRSVLQVGDSGALLIMGDAGSLTA